LAVRLPLFVYYFRLFNVVNCTPVSPTNIVEILAPPKTTSTLIDTLSQLSLSLQGG
jgi:hypothetical protein